MLNNIIEKHNDQTRKGRDSDYYYDNDYYAGYYYYHYYDCHYY